MPIIETTTRTLYKFDELSEDAQGKAIEHLYDLNVDHDWWDCIYEDAARIGLTITGFDTYRQEISGDLTVGLPECVRLITAEHGEKCDTYNTAIEYLTEFRKAAKQWRAEEWKGQEFDEDGYPRPTDKELLYYFGCVGYDAADDILRDFKKALLGDYLSMLRNEYDYQTSEEAIKEAIKANDYLFTENGVPA